MTSMGEQDCLDLEDEDDGFSGVYVQRDIVKYVINDRDVSREQFKDWLFMLPAHERQPAESMFYSVFN